MLQKFSATFNYPQNTLTCPYCGKTLLLKDFKDKAFIHANCCDKYYSISANYNEKNENSLPISLKPIEESKVFEIIDLFSEGDRNIIEEIFIL